MTLTCYSFSWNSSPCGWHTHYLHKTPSLCFVSAIVPQTINVRRLGRGSISVFPITRSITMKDCSIRRRQVPMCPAFSLTTKSRVKLWLKLYWIWQMTSSTAVDNIETNYIHLSLTRTDWHKNYIICICTIVVSNMGQISQIPLALQWYYIGRLVPLY